MEQINQQPIQFNAFSSVLSPGFTEQDALPPRFKRKDNPKIGVPEVVTGFGKSK